VERVPSTANASGTVQTAKNWAKTWTETRKRLTGAKTWNVYRQRPTRPERCKQLKTGRKRGRKRETGEPERSPTERVPSTANSSGTVQTAENWAKTWTETRKRLTGAKTWNVSRQWPTRPERCKQLKTGRKQLKTGRKQLKTGRKRGRKREN
jgi:hypothetical protein